MRLFRDSPSPAGAPVPGHRTPPIRVRKIAFAFEQVPRHWYDANPLLTHVANGLNLVFPAGERFFIRSVKHYLPQIKDAGLRERVRGFFGQEGAHGHAHEQSNEILEAQGLNFREWLSWYERVAFDQIERRFPPSLRLATTVALEHFTATLAERAFTTDFMDHAHPVMAKLLRWHAAEEIEHKSVAFDVFQAVDGRYAVRVAGLALAIFSLLYFWRSATAMLLAQEPGLTKAEIKRLRKQAAAAGHNNRFLLGAVAAYLRPGFHPDAHDNYALAERFLAEIGRLEG